ncbi:hypothetical protein ACFVYR_04275 [Streptomyces sp. NPDC058284]|uniref:hypothetical protein n=1 Tax=Streptomyces sp. NPDC058284 TaxID=3346421 RepID=UPI0036E82BD8
MSEKDMKAVGEGTIWFIAPQTDNWSDLLETHDGHLRGKFPLWVDAKTLPKVSVRRTDDTPGTGRAELTPTSEGLPGALPMGLDLPDPGCWQVTAAGREGQARILVNAR